MVKTFTCVLLLFKDAKINVKLAFESHLIGIL